MATRPTVLLIEDDHEVAGLLGRALASTLDGFAVTSVASARAGLTHLATGSIDCVLLDYRLPDGDGLDCLRSIRTTQPNVPVIMITGAGSEQVAVEAMKLGATDYLVKHGTYHRTVSRAVREALRHHGKARSVAVDPTARDPLTRIVGTSTGLRSALALVAQAAGSTAPVLVEGETGTGKELFTRAIHTQSARAGGPFVTVNCAALPATLLESELFGHVRGAFTGADRERRGLFEEADRGTLFLDEVGEMGLPLQATLLRVLEDGLVRPLGMSRPRRVDVRVVAATNCDLVTASRERRFRSDLLYRLRVFPIRLPPLRERRDDIVPLAMHFLHHFAARERKAIPGFAPDALTRLEGRPWPGNVRELQNEVQRLVLVAPADQPIAGSLIESTEGLTTPAQASDRDGALRSILRDVEVATVCERLERFGYHRTATARSLGITREALWLKLRQLGITLPRRGTRRE